MRREYVLKKELFSKETIKGKTKPKYKAELCLHYIQGNSAPHFALCAGDYNPMNGGDGYCCCANHEILADEFPEANKFVDLHLCDHDGIPMYAVENGHYYFHNEEWNKDKRIQVVKDHFRISQAEAETLYASKPTKKDLAEFCKLNQSRWLEEARAFMRYLGATDKQIEEIETEYAREVNFDDYRKEPSPEDIKAKIDKKRASKIEDLQKEIENKAWHIDVLKNLWSLDIPPRFEENLIYYSHTQEWCFGWYKKLSFDSEQEIKAWIEEHSDRLLPGFVANLRYTTV